GWQVIKWLFFALSLFTSQLYFMDHFSIVVWNIHGIGSRCSLRLLKDYKCKFKPLILVLVEPKISGNIADDISYDLGFDCWVRMESVGFSGGIWLFWMNLVGNLLLFPNASLSHLERIVSDHCPLLLDVGVSSPRYSSSPFQFRAAWLSHLSFLKRMHRLLARLKGIQCVMNSKKHAGLRALELKLKKDLDLVLDQEEIVWFQKSRERWIIYGDRNTAFFHASAVLKGSKKRISRLKDSFYIWLWNFIKIYIQLIVVTGLSSLPLRIPVISSSNLEIIYSPLTVEEDKTALWDMDSYKAPGPDVFPVAFFQKSWTIVGVDLVNMALSFLNGGALVVGACDILITLLPKVEVSESISQFRQISLCNVSFKVITKALANRIKQVLPSLTKSICFGYQNNGIR
ncbi:hypothetical protein P3X46_034239, partial [Hevea brasiliensis]